MALAAALAGGVAASQAPEFAQQYRQRIGGAIEEIGRVIADFDRDAAKNGLSRTEALAAHEQSPQPLFRDRGASMKHSIERFDRLERQRTEFEQKAPVAQPLALFDSDRSTLEGAWRDFSPAVPVTSQGFAWGAAGFAVAGGLIWLVAELVRSVWRRAHRRPGRATVQPAPAGPAARV